jgi:AraC-like DNA-binding protein
VNISFFEPRVELRPFIRSIWAFESETGLPLSDVSIAAPNGSPKLIVNCENAIMTRVDHSNRETRDHNLYFVGVRDIPVILHTKRAKTCFLGIEFHPQGAYPILKVPMVELTNRLLAAPELFKDWSSSVTETVADLKSAREKADFIQHALFRKLLANPAGNPVVDYCVDAMNRTSGLIPVSDLEHRTGYSKRYLEMLFRQHVGVSPKVLAGIFRFQKFYRKWAQGQSYGALREELYSHYYDQAHFARDFKRMTGFSPQRFVSSVPNEFGRQLSLK